MRSILVMVAKEPVPARVKTRLCPPLNPRLAAELYGLFIQDMVEEMSKIRSYVELAVAYTPEGARASFESMLRCGVAFLPQQGQDLGERLHNIFKRLFGGGYDQVYVVNSDSPDLPRELMENSFRLLAETKTELVLGPCQDGGYYLIGLKRPIPELFQGIPWSTDQVLEKTLEQARLLGLSFSLLEPWYDIDTHDDLMEFLARNQGREGGDRAPGWRSLRYLRTEILRGRKTGFELTASAGEGDKERSGKRRVNR